MFVQLGLQLISDMSMRICSEASIAENPLLHAVFLREFDVAYVLKCKVSTKKIPSLLLNVIYFRLLCNSKYFYIYSFN